MKKLMIVTALLLFAGIAFGQTLNRGSIVAVHNYNIVLQPDITLNQFLDFMEKTYKPEFEKAFPGTTIVGLMGDRGVGMYTFAGMIIFDSKDIRDKYFPVADEGVSNWTGEQQKTWQKLNEEIGKMVLDLNTTYTDWKIL
jgi:hypothetical protein